MEFHTPPTQITYTYTYTFTPQGIQRSDGYQEATSCGTIMSEHFDNVKELLTLCALIRNGKAAEPEIAYFDDSLKSLDYVVPTMELHLKEITGDWWHSSFPFRSLAQRAGVLMNDLKSGRFYESGRAIHKLGRLKMRVIGEQLYGILCELLWEMDNTDGKSEVDYEQERTDSGDDREERPRQDGL